MSGRLGEQEMRWENEPQVTASTAFSSSPKLDKNTENMFSISFRKHKEKRKTTC